MKNIQKCTILWSRVLFWGANRFLPNKENHRILWNPKVHCRIYRCPLLVHILKRINPVHAHPFYFIKVPLNILLPSTPGSSKRYLSPCFPTKTLCAPLLSPIRATCPAHFILLDLITQYWVSSTDHEAPHYVVFSTSALLRPSQDQISTSVPYSRTPSAYVPPSVLATMFHTHTKQAKL